MSKKLLAFNLGIPIAEIGTDGQYNVKDYLLYSNDLGSEDLNSFSVCIRFNVEFLRPSVTTLISYSTFISDNTFAAWLSFKDGKNTAIDLSLST